MSEAEPGLIVIHGDNPWVRLVGYRVWIDGWPAGYVARGGSTQYLVNPGTHTVQVVVEGYRSLPSRPEVAPGSKTDLRIAWGPRSTLKSLANVGMVIIVVIVYNFLIRLLQRAGYLSALGVVGFLLVDVCIACCLFVGLILIPRLLVKDYWALWILEPMSAAVPESPSSVAR